MEIIVELPGSKDAKMEMITKECILEFPGFVYAVATNDCKADHEAANGTTCKGDKSGNHTA